MSTIFRIFQDQPLRHTDASVGTLSDLLKTLLGSLTYLPNLDGRVTILLILNDC